MINTAYFEDNSNQFPMIGFDDDAAVLDFNMSTPGKTVGWLKVVCALGSPDQINRLEAERERQRQLADEEEKRKQQYRMHKKDKEEEPKKDQYAQVEALLRELIDTLKDQGGSNNEKRDK